MLLRSLAEIEQRFPALTNVYRSVGPAGAIMPLVSRGRLVGGLVFVFSQEQTFDEAQLRAISTFAALCGDALARATEHETERHIATTLQRSLLPAQLPAIDNVDLAARYLPAAGAHTGGDWYDAACDDSGQVIVSVGDVCGKGISAAALMGRLRIAAKAYAIDGYSPAQIVARLDRFGATLPEFTFTTTVVVSLNPSSGQLTLCRAGHLPPLLLPTEGNPYFVWDGGGLPMGVNVNQLARTDAFLRLRPGDALLLYSDGLIEQRETTLDSGMRELAAAASAATSGDSAQHIADSIVRTLARPPTAPHSDDIAVLVLRYKAQPPP